MIVDLLNLFLGYILLSMIISFVLGILPKPLREGFSILGNIREAISYLTLSIFGDEENFEVSLFAIFILPFTLFFLIFIIIQSVMYINTDFSSIDIWLFLLSAFLLSFFIPSTDELQVMRKSNSISIFVFIFKVFLGIQLIIEIDYTHIEEFVLALWLLPLSKVLRF